MRELRQQAGFLASLARLEAALNDQYAELYENKVYQYHWGRCAIPS